MSSLTTTATRIAFSGSGSVDAFNTGFWVQAAADLTVYTRVTSTEVDTLLVLDTDYTVTRLDQFTGAIVTLLAGNLASGSDIIIYRDPTPTATLNDLTNTSSLFPTAIQRAMDYLTALVQNSRHVQARSIRLPSRHALTFEEMLVDDDSTDLASRFIAIRSDGVTPWPASPTNVPVSDLMVLLLESLTPAAAHIILEIADRILIGGGTEGMGLVKTDGDDYNVEWAITVPINGTVGQILEKASSTKFDAAWVAKIVTPTTVELTSPGTTYTLVIGDAQLYKKMSDGTGIAITVPPNSAVAFPVGTEISFEQAGAGQLTFGEGSGVTINFPSAQSLLTFEATAVVALKKVATDIWTLMGNLAAA